MVEDRGKGKWNATHDLGIIDAQEDPHLTRYDLLIPLDLLHGLQYDLACDVHWRCQSGGIGRGLKGE